MTPTETTINHINHWVSAKTYAKQAGIGIIAVHNRAKRKAIAATKIDGVLVIDVQLSPPRKTLARKHVAPVFVSAAGMPALAKLVSVNAFCDRKSIRTNKIFTAIILGKMPAWCFAGQVFVEKNPLLEQYITRRKKQ